MWCGARAPHARAAYAKAAEIRSEPCSLTALRLNLQFSPGELPSFVGVLSGCRVCNSVVQQAATPMVLRGALGVNPFLPLQGFVGL